MLLLENCSKRVLKVSAESLISKRINVRGVWWIVEKLCEVHGDPLFEGLVPSPADCLLGTLQSRNCSVILHMMRNLILKMLNCSSSVLWAHRRAAEQRVLAMCVQTVITGHSCCSMLSNKAFVV